MTALIIILKAFLLGFFLAHFEPLQEALKPVKKRMKDKYFLVFYLKTSMSCHKCLAFWSGLIMSGNLYFAIAASLIAFVFDKMIEPKEIWKN